MAQLASEVVDVFVLAGMDSNILGRSNNVASASQTPSSTFPLSRLFDERPSQRFIFPAVGEDDWIEVECQEVPNGGLDSWGGTPNVPASWTVIETGSGTVTEETVTVVSGSALNLTSGGAAPANNAQAYVAFEVLSGGRYELRASIETSGTDPAPLEVFNPDTGKFLTSSGAWSRHRQNVFEESSTTYVNNTLQFQVEDYDTVRRHSTTLRIRAHQDNATASRTYLYDNVFLVPVFTFSSIHSHNIEEIIVPRVSYSDSTMGATVPIDASAAVDGNDWITRSSNFTGLIDSRRGSVSMRFRLDGNGGSQHIFLANEGNHFLVLRSSGGTVEVRGFNSSSSQILQLTSTITVAADGTWHHLAASWDLVAGVASMQIDGVDRLAGGATLTNDDIDYVRGSGSWTVFAGASGVTPMVGALGDLWFYGGQYIDFDVADNLALFRSANGFATYLGVDGSVPVGSPPHIYLNGDHSSFLTNASGAGDFTSTTGTLIADVGLFAEFDIVDPAFYCKGDTDIYARFIRLRFLGQQTDEIEIGQWVAGDPIALLRNPTQDQIVDEEVFPLEVLQTRIAGERWTTKHSKQKQRQKTLRFLNRDAHQDRLAELIWERTDFGADPAVLVPDSTDAMVIHGQVERSVKTVQRRALDLVATDLTFTENPHGITLE